MKIKLPIQRFLNKIVLLLLTFSAFQVVQYSVSTRLSRNVGAQSSELIVKDTNYPIPTYILDPSFDHPSKSNPSDYRQHVDFNVVCNKISRIAPDDPIVWPNQPGKSHIHVFTGNVSINAYSTLASLEASGTNCNLDRDKASYWFPELYDETGKVVMPNHMRAYYRAGSLNPVTSIPHGLKMIAGDAMAATAQSKTIAGWQCRSVKPDEVVIGKQALIPTCAAVDLLEGSVVFPNCWDGKNLDSADHKSHMAYSWADGNPDNCPTTHPVQIPQLTVAYRYPPGTTNSKAYLSSMHSGLTLHSDFWNAWHQETLDALVHRCINSGVHCGDVYPAHFPGPIPAMTASTTTPTINVSASPTLTQNPTNTHQMSVTPTQDPCSMKFMGDANCDGLINEIDFTTYFVKEYRNELLTKDSDFNRDLKVNLLDYEIWRKNGMQ